MKTSDDRHTSARPLPPAIVKSWARLLAADFDVDDPRGALRRIGVKLYVRSRSLQTTKRRIHGVWEPLLQRIELHGCDDQRRDEEIVETLGHEIWHMTTQVRHAVTRMKANPARAEQKAEEMAADVFADAWREYLGSERVHRCAGALRKLIAERDARLDRGSALSWGAGL